MARGRDRDDKQTPFPRHIGDVDEMVGRVTGELGAVSSKLNTCISSIEELKLADADMHGRMDKIVAYVEGTKGRDRVLAALGIVFLTSIGTIAVMSIRNDSAVNEVREDVVAVRADQAVAEEDAQAVAREIAELNRNLARWQATTEERIGQVDERSRRNDDAIRALERGGTRGLRQQLREQDRATE